MSHAKERKERNCLNCNAVVEDRYCSICGQENLEPQETAGHLIGHFFNDITHFDGKFFSSLKYLLTKPGFLSAEYVAGRRASYLNPVRMYVFTSFIFFLIFFSFKAGKGSGPVEFDTGSKSDTAQPAANAIKDSIRSADPVAKPAKGKNADDSAINIISDEDNGRGFFSSIFHSLDNYRDRKEYDSLTDAGKVNDGFFTRALTKKKISLKERYGDDEKLMDEKFMESFQHSIPQMFFLSLPLFALFLKLLYVRRKKFYYVAHAIFTIHFYIAVYIIALLAIFTAYLSKEFSYLHWMVYIARALVIYIFWYGYKAMRNFYGQGRLKTIIKYVLIFLWLIFVMLFVMGVMFAFSVYKL